MIKLRTRPVTSAFWLLIAALVCSPSPTALDAREAQYATVVRNDVMVAMRDGVKLATDIYLPALARHAQAHPFIALRWRTRVLG